MESLLQNFLTLTYVPWINEFLFTEDNSLSHLIKQESYSSQHCIFQSGYAFNTRSIKIHQRSNVKVFITLLIKNNFMQHIDWLLTYV